MKLRHFFIGLDSDDFLIKNPPGSEFPYSVKPIVSDFSFLTHYFGDYMSRSIRKLSFDTNDFNALVIRGRKEPRGTILKSHFKSLNLEVYFNEKLFKDLYPFKNDYPIGGLLHPVIKQTEFSEFLHNLCYEGINNYSDEKFRIPKKELLESFEEFKGIGFINEWIHKRKGLTGTGLTAYLVCSLTANSFKLKLSLKDKIKQEIFAETILETLPSSNHYHNEFKDIKFKNQEIIVTKRDGDELFRMNLG